MTLSIGLVGAGAADLLDRQVGVIGLNCGDGGEGGIDAILCLLQVARDLEVHQSRVAVGRDLAVAGERRPHVFDVPQL